MPETVLVTGSSRGIGLAIAEKYADMGCNVVFNCARSGDAMAKAVARCQTVCRNPNVMGVCADVSDYGQVNMMRQHIRDRFGDVTILVNNAGLSHIGLFTDMLPEDWRRVLDVNLNAVVNCCHVFVPPMVQAKSGAVVNISSMWGVSGASCEAIYAAAKGGVNAFTKSLAKELAPSGVRVNAIACGIIDTQMNAGLTEAERAQLADAVPMGRFGQTQEIAQIAYFLTSEAAGYLTGQIVTVDGGLT